MHSRLSDALRARLITLLLAAFTALSVSGQSVILNPVNLPATDFPDDGLTGVFTTSDSNVVFTTLNAFNVQSNWFGDIGGVKDNSYDGSETLSVDLVAGVGLQGFALRWARTDIVITGLTADPQAVVSVANGAGAGVAWNEVAKTLTLDIPWDAGVIRTVTFGNPAASEGRNLLFSFTDATAGWQASFTSFDYGVVSNVPPLTYALVSGNELWPADKRAAIVAAMDEAVAHYNAYGYFPKALTVNYDTNVPTANGNYNGRINFGGQISTRTALHEIGHTLGVGTVGAWSTYSSTGTWTGPRANARVQIYDGSSAAIGCDTQHFWPYGLNFASGDGYLSRIRHVRMVAALRWDLGIVTDSDADGLPDDWERFHFNTLAQTGAGDFDADSESNLTEYNNDTDPRDGISAFTTTLLVNNASGAGQASYNYGPATLSAFFGAGAVSPNAAINSGSLAYLGVNSSAVPTDSNVNAINDRDGINGGSDQERLRIALQSRHGLARLTWNFSRADGPLATDGVSISGFNSDPQAVFSGGISAANPIYSAGKLTFQISAFTSAVHTVTFASPAASSNATLEITVADSTQAGAQFALQSLSFMNLNQPPVATNIPLSAPLGGMASVQVIGGSFAPTDPEGDALTVSAAGPAVHGRVQFTGTNVTYISTNAAAADSFVYVVSDGFGGSATNSVAVTLVVPPEFNLLSGSRIEAGSFRFDYRGLAERSYVIEAAAALVPPVSWTPQLTNAAGADGWWHVIVPGTESQRFFRVRELP